MPVLIDQHLREHIAHEESFFPISFFENELSELPGREGPLHWHPDFEIARAEAGILDYQVEQDHILLRAGDILLVNRNRIHGVRQIAGALPDPLPNMVFSATLIAPESSTIYQKYIAPVSDCTCLPYIVFRQGEGWCGEACRLVDDIFTLLRQQPPCYEMAVQRNLSRLFEFLFLHFDALPRFSATGIQLRAQVRVQKTLAYIYAHYAEPLTCADIARAASISRSEAARCFHAYMDCSPVNALIRYRLQVAHRLLQDASLTVQEISLACGFCSAGYFTRQFRKAYGYTPGQARTLGK